MYRPNLASYTIAASVLLSWLLPVNAQFNPREYPKKIAKCQASKRTPDNTEAIEIGLRYVEINPGAAKTILMVHGWPSLWSTWSNQIQEFKDDYHLIIPDLRGFGESEHPGDPRPSGNMGDMADDLGCILEHAGVNSTICLGHDWGSQVCFEAARMRPDVFTAVIGAVVPYIPSAGPFVPVKHMVSALPALAYQVYFDSELDTATAELDKDIRRTVRATLRTVDSPPPKTFLLSNESFLDAWGHVEEIPSVPFFSIEEEDYFVEQYGIQGFRNTLQFYITENRYASWELVQNQGNFIVPVPALAIYPLNDPVADWTVVAHLLGTAKFVPNLTSETLEGAHWVHMENPVKFNAVVRAWLRKLDESKCADANLKQESRTVDEL
ncbi:hypothetical protein D9615_008132 [Tricholomella constricta]|uniref:AB hydrolase-1 domain-containing protein n=1 Tax=Tricholomella constricta TaxID=117010 RepID=A0A8H5GVU6_9AGAR|nr:hypothetical protein D9615_008132 [Tricholomella constricta]